MHDRGRLEAADGVKFLAPHQSQVGNCPLVDLLQRAEALIVVRPAVHQPIRGIVRDPKSGRSVSRLGVTEPNKQKDSGKDGLCQYQRLHVGSEAFEANAGLVNIAIAHR
jgi:hypothetical protein